MSNIKLVGLASNATGGKDTLYSILEKKLLEFNISTDRIALADPLKAEINDFTKFQYNISSFTKNPKEKEIIRPLMVVHGKIKRLLTDGKYFTTLATPRVLQNKKDNILSIITDIRYAKYQEDEVTWLKKHGGLIVYLERINQDGSIVPPANEDEKENNVKIKEIADFKFSWPTTDDMNVREDYVNYHLKGLIERIKNV